MFLLPIASLPPYPLTRSVFLLVAAAAANALALLPLLPNASPTLQLPPPLPPPPRAPATLDNATTTTMTTNAGNAIRVTCSAALGSGMVASSCADAVGYSPLGDRQESWGVPGRQMPGALALDVELPDNVFSGKWLLLLLCGGGLVSTLLSSRNSSHCSQPPPPPPTPPPPPRLPSYETFDSKKRKKKKAMKRKKKKKRERRS